MSKTVNQITLVGNVGGEPTVNTLSDGTKVAQFSVATSTGGYKSSDGRDIPEITQWHRVVAWRKLADVAQGYIHKGNRVFVQGRVEYRSYDAKDGSKREITEVLCTDIVLLEKPQQTQGNTQQMAQKAVDMFTQAGMPVQPTYNNDLPF